MSYVFLCTTDTADANECKRFFELHYSHVYFVFFDSLCSVEAGLKTKMPKQAKEELDSVVFVLEKILIFLPELIHRRWQFHSLKHVMLKLLHPGNAIRVREDGIRCFLLWYQILGSPVESEIRVIYDALIPMGQSKVDPFTPESRCTMIQPVEIEPLLSPAPTDPIPKNLVISLLKTLMDQMVTTVVHVHWREQSENMYLSCFRFLLDQFSSSYVKIIFPEVPRESLYRGSFELPAPRALVEENEIVTMAKATVIQWFCKYLGPPEALSSLQHKVVRKALSYSRESVDLINELFRQTFLLPFSQSETMLKVIEIHRIWLSGRQTSELPPFLEEPATDCAIQVGASRINRAFIVHASYVFVVQIPPERPLILEQQVEVAKKVLNLYRYMVMNVAMDKETWELFLHVLLQVTSFIIPVQIPMRKEQTLGGRMAPALFQTIIVTWIRANLQVTISLDLWERFQMTLSALTQWEELVREWARNLDTTTRVMVKYVYNINLSDLPLDKLNADRKDRRRRAATEAAPLQSHNVHNKEPQVTNASSSVNSSVKKLPANRRLSGRVKSANKLRRSTSDSQINVLGKSKRRHSRRSLEQIPRGSPELQSDHSRSPSPSSGRDSTSLKESPLNLDGVSLHSNASDTSNPAGQAHRSVMVGGSRKGWATDTSVIMWRRMVGVLGDVNAISSPLTHALAMECLHKIVSDFSKVKDNLAVGEVSPPSPPSVIPPVGFFSPWLLKAMQLEERFKKGKLIALKTLCLSFLTRFEIPPSPDILCHFYNVLVQCLLSSDLETVALSMQFCGSRPFVYGLPGATILLNPLLEAASIIINADVRQDIEVRSARHEAIALLGTVIGFAPFLEQVHRLNQSIEPDRRNESSKERALTLLFKACRKELSPMERALALVSIGLLVHQELSLRQKNNRLAEAVNWLISSTQYVDRLLLRVSCEMLSLQIEHAVHLLDDYPDLPKKIIEGLARSLLVSINQGRSDSSAKEVALTIILCLGEWCMAVPVDYLKSSGILTTVMRTLHGVLADTDLIHSECQGTLNTSSDACSIRLAARLLLGFLQNHLGHFPRSQLGASNLNCDLENDEKCAYDPLYFVLEDYSIMSFTRLSNNRVRVVWRDLTGKFAWDCTEIQDKASDEDDDRAGQRQTRAQLVERTSDEFDEAEPEGDTDRIDLLSSLLSCVGQGSPESGRGRRPSTSLLSAQAEENLIALLLNQHYQEMNYLEQRSEGRDLSISHADTHVTQQHLSNIANCPSSPLLPWPQCRRLVDQLALLSWERRGKVTLLNSSDRVKRELRNLDSQRCRETHKIAVIYVAEGQEDKNSILLNKCGSKAFEAFVAGLGWEVDLQTHAGFRGGLQSNGSTGTSAPYYCTPLCEVIFHVSTRIPASEDQADSLTRKLRHLGNDEIHIVWSEHWRDYRRGIIPTEFGDVLIVIYPVAALTDMYRIEVIRKGDVQFFGPLYTGCVVHSSLLPSLVRATAINASRAQRLNVPFYQTFFEERANCLASAIKSAEDTSFEDLASTVYISPQKFPPSPALLTSAIE